MKCDEVEQYIEKLQKVVDGMGETISVKETYDRCVRSYFAYTKPNIYCLRGEEYKTAKREMREHCFGETAGLVNIVLNSAKPRKK